MNPRIIRIEFWYRGMGYESITISKRVEAVRRYDTFELNSSRVTKEWDLKTRQRSHFFSNVILLSTSEARVSMSTSAVFLPFSIVAYMYPLASSSSATFVPTADASSLFFWNPYASLVTLPFSSTRICSGGPRTRSVSSSCFVSQFKVHRELLLQVSQNRARYDRRVNGLQLKE